MQIKQISFSTIHKPLKITFATSLGTKNFITSVFVKTILKNGSCGIGEIPTSFAVKHETLPVILNTLKEIKKQLLNSNIENYQEIVVALRKKYNSTPMTISGLETSLFRSYLSYKNMNEFYYWHKFFNSEKLVKKPVIIETDITIPFIADFNKIKKWITAAIKNKFKIFKLKISGSVYKDKKIISYVYSILTNFFSKQGENFILRLDGNQGYNTNSYMKLLDFLNHQQYKIQLIEQPLKKDDYKGLKYVKQQSYIPIVLDETIFSKKDLEFVILENLAHGVNLKIAKSGLLSTAEMVLTAKKNGLSTMIGCMTETIVGLSSAINMVAAANNKFDYIDLDSVFFLSHKQKYDSIKICSANFVIE